VRIADPKEFSSPPETNGFIVWRSGETCILAATLKTPNTLNANILISFPA
jgi:hypothetical protein